jgi:hypothetical protein
MAFSYALPFVYWQKLVKCATKKQLQPKTCQKPYAKTPQKTHKNPIKIWWDKNFYIFLNINTNKKPKT